MRWAWGDESVRRGAVWSSGTLWATIGERHVARRPEWWNLCGWLALSRTKER